MNCQIEFNVESFLTSWGTVNFSRSLHHGIS